MSTIKISQLPVLPNISSNTSNPTIVPVFTGVQTSPGTKYRYVYSSTNNTWYAMP